MSALECCQPLATPCIPRIVLHLLEAARDCPRHRRQEAAV